MKKFYCFLTLLVLCSLFAAGCSDSDREVMTEQQEEVQETGIKEEKNTEETTGETVAFHGLTPGGDVPRLGFQSVNNRKNQGENYVCVDSETGKIYYVNAGKDNYLYCLDGNKKKLVLKKFVDCINVLDNVLYFRYGKKPHYDPYQQNSYQGKAYSYDLKTKKMTCLTEDEITWLAVSEEGLYCHFGFESPKYGSMIYFSAFGTGTWEPVFEDSSGMHLEIYKNYLLKKVVDTEGEYQKFAWVDRKTKEEVDFLGKKEYTGNSFLYEDYFYASIDDGETLRAYRIDLTNGKRNSYWLEAVDLGGGHVMGDDYKSSVLCLVEMNGKVYSGSDVYGALWVGDADGDRMEMVKVAGSNHYYRRLYMAENRLFAWYDNGIVELVVSDDGIREKSIK